MNERYFGLDAARAAAILLVLLSHGTFFISDALAAVGIGPIGFLWATGISGVELFFGLSGFLIGRILLELQERDASPSAIRIFLVRRWLRTLPLYYLVLGILYLVPMLDPSMRERVWSYLLLSQNLITTMPPGNWFGISWSLTIEEWSYLLLPMLAFGLFRRTRNPVVVAALSLCIAGFSARFALLDSGIGWDNLVRKEVVTRLDAIAYGVLIAALLHRKLDGGALRWLRRLAVVNLAIVGGSIWLFYDPARLDGLYGRVFALPVASLSIACLLPLIAELRAPKWIDSPIRFVARISYATYLVHWPVMSQVGSLPKSIQFITYMVATFAVSALLSYCIEQPILRMRPRQEARSRPDLQIIEGQRAEGRA